MKKMLVPDHVTDIFLYFYSTEKVKKLLLLLKAVLINFWPLGGRRAPRQISRQTDYELLWLKCWQTVVNLHIQQTPSNIIILLVLCVCPFSWHLSSGLMLMQLQTYLPIFDCLLFGTRQVGTVAYHRSYYLLLLKTSPPK